MSLPLSQIPKNCLNFTVSSKPGTTCAACFGTVAITLSVIALTMTVIFILGATGVIPAISSLIAISSLGTSLGITTAMATLPIICFAMSITMTILGVLLIRYSHSSKILYLEKENHT